MKKFELTLIIQNNKQFEPDQVEKIEVDDFIELLTKFSLLVVNIQRQLDKKGINTEDDIPF